MKKQIIWAIMLVTGLALIGTTVVAAFIYQHTLEQQVQSELRNSALCISQGIRICGADYFDNASFGADRVTWIDASGNVLYDSVADPQSMGNHADREEVRQAIASGESEILRYSETLAERTYNYARLMDDGTVLRVSATQKSVLVMIFTMLRHMILILLIAVVLAVLLATLESRKITEPINNIDLEHPKNSHVYAELMPLLDRIEQQNDVIARQMKQIQEESTRQENIRREFTANVSHELKTPLTTISGTAELLQSGMVRSEDVPHFAENIYHEAQRMTALVNDIINLTQLEENRIITEKEPVDLYDLAQDVLQFLEDEAAKNEVRLWVSGDHACVIGVRKILDEMIYNLCDNAIKYNRPGGSVEVCISSLPNQIVLSVADTGIGIPSEHHERIFERFYRVDKSHSRQMGGTGLGLSIVKHGAIFHNATIELDSQPNVGTTIRVRFPLPDRSGTARA